MLQTGSSFTPVRMATTSCTRGTRQLQLKLLDTVVVTLRTNWPLIMINIYHEDRERKDQKAGTRKLGAMYGGRNLSNWVERVRKKVRIVGGGRTKY